MKELAEYPKHTEKPVEKPKEQPKNTDKNITSYINLPKYDHKDLLLEQPIKIQKRKAKEQLKRDSGEEDSQEDKRTGPKKKIKKDEGVKEKIMAIRNKKKGYEISDDSSESSFDEMNYPALPNK